jgi:hypothetical protein
MPFLSGHNRWQRKIKYNLSFNFTDEYKFFFENKPAKCQEAGPELSSLLWLDFEFGGGKVVAGVAGGSRLMVNVSRVKISATELERS